MKTILVATNNEHKLKEIRSLLSEYKIISLNDLNDHTEVIEDKDTFEGNAYVKAKFFHDKYHISVISDDTGLVCPSLNGQPGVYSARYANCTDPKNKDRLNREKLLEELKSKDRSAYFECVICYIDENSNVSYFNGVAKGHITNTSEGNDGFGYDCIFYSDDLQKTFGNATEEEKNSVSHRGRAIEKLKTKLLEEQIINIGKNILQKDVSIDGRLLGGMSNYTYVIKDDKSKYTVRIPGEKSELFTCREKEKEGIEIFENLGLTTNTIYFDTKTGIKVSKYLEGNSLNEINEKYYTEVSNILHQYHDSNISYDKDYEMFKRLDLYESYLENSSKYINSEYIQTKNLLCSYKTHLESQKKVFCHNDSQPSNFIKTTNSLKIVDFEFIGNNDPLYDVACFGNIDFTDALNLLKVYKNPNIDDYINLNLHRAFQCLQWYLVASYKDLIHMSEKLKIPFYDVAISYLKLCQKHLNDAKKLEDEKNLKKDENK